MIYVFLLKITQFPDMCRELHSYEALTKRVSATADATETTRYSYDANGNLFSEASYMKSATVGEESVMLGTVGGNNAEGLGKIVLYGYNKLNQLVSYESESVKASYTYNADGLRESKTVDGKTTQYYYNGGLVINESENGSLSATNLLGVNSIIGRKAGAESAYFAKNGHGDVTKAVGLDGSVKASYETDVWGEVTGETGTFDNPIRYAGEYYDAESGNIYLRARYYDPTGGRFLSEDPVKDGLNWYAYCYNNPINFVDPWGLKYVPLRATVEGLGGSVVWENGVASVYMDMTKGVFYVGDGTGTFEENDRLYVDDAILFAVMAVKLDLGNGWSGRIERDASGGNYYRKHVHVWKGGQSYAQNDDGSPHDGSTGSPPNSVLKELKRQKNWDWKAKEDNWISKIKISVYDNGTTQVVYPNGSVYTLNNPYGKGLSAEDLKKLYALPMGYYNFYNPYSGAIVIPAPNPVPVPVPALVPLPA